MAITEDQLKTLPENPDKSVASPGKDHLLQVDGGINRKTIAAAAAAGADCFVAGSAIFGKEDYAAEVAALRALAEQAG